LSEIATMKKAGASSVTTRAPGSIEVYRDDFERQPTGPDWLQVLRKQGMARFQALGFPTTKNEDWHFTSVAPIAERIFRLATLESANAASGVKRADLARFNFGENAWHTLVFEWRVLGGSFVRRCTRQRRPGEQSRARDQIRDSGL
jgi:hypothetical protein